LVPLNCTNGSGTFVQATTDPQPAGTQIFVAIDGAAGSNCKYSLTGINVYGVLSEAEFRQFSVWKNPTSNRLRWKGNSGTTGNYQVERSLDGKTFISIGAIPAQGSTDFSFEDQQPVQKTFYRIVFIDQQGRKLASRVIIAQREEATELSVAIVKMNAHNLVLRITKPTDEPIHYKFVSVSGILLEEGLIRGTKGVQTFYKNTQGWPAGMYLMQLGINDQQKTLRIINP
jgi:hypothetical protein